MSKKLRGVISRLSMPNFEVILTPSVLNIVNAFQSNPDKAILAEVSTKIFSPVSILNSEKKRTLILENLEKEEAIALCEQIDKTYDEENPWEKLKNYRFNSKKKLSYLYKYFDLDNLAAPAPEELKIISLACETVSTEYPLFSHQEKASTKIKEVFKTESRVLLHMPTGAGKTRTSMNIVCDYLRQNQGGLVVWLANSEELCIQACDEFKKAWQYLGSRDIQMHRVFGQATSNLVDISSGFVVGGLQMLGSRFDKDQEGRSQFAQKTGLVVFDEAHMAIAPTYSHIVETFMVQGDAMLLGLSATPGRSTFDEETNEKFADFFERNKVTLNVEGYDNPVTYLQENEYLATARYHNLTHKSDNVKLSATELSKIADGQEIPKRILKLLAEDTKRNVEILSVALEEIQKGRQIILFAISVEHAETLYALLCYKNVKAGLVSSKTDPFSRKSQIEDYKNKKLDILINYGVLTTGFDAPNTSVAIIARPTNSLTLFSQMVGRALRGKKAGGNKYCDIYTVIDDELPSFKNMALAFTHWDEAWN